MRPRTRTVRKEPIVQTLEAEQEIDTLPEPAPVPRVDYFVDELGFKIDDETGEVLGHVKDDQKEAFCIDSFAKVDWALEVFLEIDVQIESLKADSELAAARARFQALDKNLSTLRKQAERKRAYLEGRWGPDLTRFCQQNVAKGQRSIQRRYGALKLRAVSKPTVAILDKVKAFEWAINNKRFELLKPEFYLSHFINGETLPTAAFKVTPPHDSLSIVTNAATNLSPDEFQVV
jgi:hypothetical protein